MEALTPFAVIRGLVTDQPLGLYPRLHGCGEGRRGLAHTQCGETLVAADDALAADDSTLRLADRHDLARVQELETHITPAVVPTQHREAQGVGLEGLESAAKGDHAAPEHGAPAFFQHDFQ